LSKNPSWWIPKPGFRVRETPWLKTLVTFSDVQQYLQFLSGHFRKHLHKTYENFYKILKHFLKKKKLFQ